MQGSMTYNITGADLTWSKLFLQLEQHKERLNVVDYSVSQTTLEQVTAEQYNTTTQHKHTPTL